MRAHRSTLAIAAALALTLACDGLALADAQSHGSPVTKAAPAAPPNASRSHGVCVVREAEDGSGSAKGLVWVEPNPTGVVTIWYPGLGSHECQARRVVSGKAVADHLAQAIEHAPKVTGREYACPADDGSRVDVYFTYAGSADEYVEAGLTGCRWIEAPRRGARWITNAISNALQSLAPPAWHRYN